MKRLILFAIAAGSAFAQLNGPMLGWTPDGSRVRPMYGLAGASAFGDPVNIGRDLALIAPSPVGNFVVATAADNGQALLIANGAASAISGIPNGAARIAISPQGSSAAFWYSTGHFEIVTGLPASLSVRDIDASFLEGAPAAFALSDDGQSLAGSWRSGSYLFNANGSAALPVSGQIEALAFFPQQSTVLAATADSIVSISNSVATILYDGARRSTMRRLTTATAISGIAASFDDQQVVVANRSGEILALNLANGTSSSSICDCTPEGVFGLGSTAFRLTSPSSGEVKLFDASTDSVFVVPPMLTMAATPSLRAAPSGHLSGSATLPALPAVTFTGIPTTTGYQQQPPMGISIASAYPVDLTGTATLTFQSSVGGDDQMIQFTAGGRTASFTIPAGSTQASFSGKTTLPFSTGTVAGTITITLDFVASGTDVTPSPAPKLTYTTTPTVPFISLVTLNQSTGGVTVIVSGFSSSRDMASGTFQFAAATGTSISNPTLNVALASAFTTWYASSASTAFGSQFMLTMPFPVQGQAGNIVAVTVTLTNSKGTSNPVSQ